MTLKIYKKSEKVWQFVDSLLGEFIPSRFSINTLNNNVTIVFRDGADSRTFSILEVELFDIGAVSPFPIFATAESLMAKLEEMNCPCFLIGGEYIFDPSAWVSSDVDNGLEIGTDGKFYVAPSGGDDEAILIEVSQLPTVDILNTKIYVLPNGSWNWYNGTEWVSAGESKTILFSRPSAPVEVLSSTNVLVESIVIPAGTFKAGNVYEFLFCFVTSNNNGAVFSAGFNDVTFNSTVGRFYKDVALISRTFATFRRQVIFYDNDVFLFQDGTGEGAVSDIALMRLGSTQNVGWLNKDIDNTLNVATNTTTGSAAVSYLYTLIRQVN